MARRAGRWPTVRGASAAALATAAPVFALGRAWSLVAHPALAWMAANDVWSGWFDANVATHSDGRLLHGSGGWQNCLYGGCPILAVASFRDHISVIVDELRTVTDPGEPVEVVATERGSSVNPRREDLLGATLPERARILAAATR
jgi:hypothetical protein